MKLEIPRWLAFALRNVFRQRTRSAGTLAAISLGVAGLILAGPVGVAENWEHLAAVVAPTLLIWGSEDEISPLANSDILLAGIAGARREVLDGAPHPCYLAQPERWHELLRTFFAALPA